jgi:hypothetical protein
MDWKILFIVGRNISTACKYVSLSLLLSMLWGRAFCARILYLSSNCGVHSWHIQGYFHATTNWIYFLSKGSEQSVGHGRNHD